MTETCRNCRFGHLLPYEGVDNHYCRINPPEFIPPNSTALKPISPEGWCGKWLKIPSTEWPAYCHSPSSCDRNGRCMYIKCRHENTDIKQSAAYKNAHPEPAVPAPVSDPDTVRSQKLSVRTRPKKGVAAII